MKKLCKLFSLIIVVALLASVLVGCASFGKNATKYRESTAIKVGTQNITVGKLLDSFNSYYNSYYSYVSAGYISVEDLFDMAVSSLYSQYAKIDKYVTDSASQSFTHDWTEQITNSKFLSKQEMEYVIKYMKYTMYTLLDGEVEELISADRDIVLNDEQAEDTSRDFTQLEYDNDGQAMESYAKYQYDQICVNEEMTEYLDKYYASTMSLDYSVDGYVFATEASASKKLSALNDRLPEGTEKITFAELVSFQQNALKTYKQSVKNAYSYDSIEDFIKAQVGEMVNNVIVSKYNNSIYGKYESDNVTSILSSLADTVNVLKNDQIKSFQMDEHAFQNLVEELTNSSIIYSMYGDDKVEDKYVYTKNVLVKFSDEQSILLSNLKKELGGADNDTYKNYRNSLAAQIVATNFSNDEEKVSGMFKLEGSEIVLNLENATVQNYFTNAGALKDGANTIHQLMVDFNEDIAQHSSKYDYVVRAGSDVPDTYTAGWVDEYVVATNQAYNHGTGVANKSYAIAVSDYGVHIVFYTGNVTAYEFDFAQANKKYLDPTTEEYKLYKAYVQTQQSTELEEAVEELMAEYKTKITFTESFDTFIKDNKIEYDKASALENL